MERTIKRNWTETERFFTPTVAANALSAIQWLADFYVRTYSVASFPASPHHARALKREERKGGRAWNILSRG